MRPVSRRRFLQLSAGAAAAAAVGAGCSSKKSRADADRDGITDAMQTTTTVMGFERRIRLHDVQHVVVILQGSASFDQVFGTRRNVRGFADPDVLSLPSGKAIWHQPDTRSADGYVLPYRTSADDPCAPALNSSWEAQHAAWHQGDMDRFASSIGPQSMAYVERADLPWYHALADEFTVCDQWFSSALGGGVPNRLFAVSGSIDPNAKAGGPAVRAGDRYGWETYPERLQRAGIGWRLYADDAAQGTNPLASFVQFQEARASDPLFDDALVSRGLQDFADDVESGALPWVSWVVAPESMTAPGEQERFAAGYLTALFAQPERWAKTVVFVVHSDSGGAFDHVPPPTPAPVTLDEYVGLAPIGLGMRVPAMVISPWSRGGSVDRTVLDHTSVLRFLEQRFGVVAPLISPWRRRTTGDLLDVLDFGAYDPSVPDLGPKPSAAPNGAAVCTGAVTGPPAKQSLPAIDR